MLKRLLLRPRHRLKQRQRDRFIVRQVLIVHQLLWEPDFRSLQWLVRHLDADLTEPSTYVPELGTSASVLKVTINVVDNPEAGMRHLFVDAAKRR